MATFPTWSEWVKLREDNARKRAVKAALAGNRPPLPGSAAACPSTNPRAMRSAQKHGVVTKEDTEQRPDYSFDRWVQKAKEFGDDLNRMRTKADADDKDLDKKRKDAEKKAEEEDKKAKTSPKPEEDDQDDDDSETKKKKDQAWTQLRKIHKDRVKQFGKEDSSPKPSATPKQR